MRCSRPDDHCKPCQVRGRQRPLSEQTQSSDKAQVENLNGDQIGALKMTNTGTTPLWVRLDTTGYPEYAPQPSSNVLQIERHIPATDGSSKSLSL